MCKRNHNLQHLRQTGAYAGLFAIILNCSTSRRALQTEEFKRWGLRRTYKTFRLQKGYAQILFFLKTWKRAQNISCCFFSLIHAMNSLAVCKERLKYKQTLQAKSSLIFFFTHYWFPSLSIRVYTIAHRSPRISTKCHQHLL